MLRSLFPHLFHSTCLGLMIAHDMRPSNTLLTFGGNAATFVYGAVIVFFVILLLLMLSAQLIFLWHTEKAIPLVKSKTPPGYPVWPIASVLICAGMGWYAFAGGMALTALYLLITRLQWQNQPAPEAT